MIQDPELEGEACYHKDDTSIDPDVALSYLDDKVQSILGHFQKDFEGGVSAENLGAKFGGYGSFLPTYQRSPSVWSQPKSPLRVQKPSTPISPIYFSPEGIPHHSGVLPNAAFSHRNCANAPPGVHHLQNLKAPSWDGSIRQDALLSDKVAESCPIKLGFPSSKSDNQTDERKLKFRIKVGSDRTTQRNVVIYSGLGLISPSSSAGNSPEESGGMSCEPHEILDESPSRILKLMTSFPVSGVLLSPLHEDILNLVRERKSPVDSEPAAALKGAHNLSGVPIHDTIPRLGNGDVLRRKKTKSVEKTANFDELKNEPGMDIKEDKKISGTETLKCRLQSSNDLNCKPVSDSVFSAGESLKGVVRAPKTIKDFESDVPVRKREGNNERVKGRAGSADVVKADSFESISGQSGGKYDYQEPKNRSAEKVGKHRVTSSQKDGSIDNQDGARSTVKKIPASLIANSDISEGETVSRGSMDPLSQKYILKSTSGEQDESRMSPAVNKLSLQGKKKLKGSRSSVKLDSNLAEESLRSATKNKLTVKKDSCEVHSSNKDVADTRSEHLDILKQSHDRSKNSNLENIKEIGASVDKHKERASSKKLNNQVNSGTNLKEAPADARPPEKGLVAETAQTPVAGVLIEEHWVACDRCQKWRLLPIGTVPQNLPDKWVCSMLNWLPGLNRCDISEDETTKALYALYQVPFPDNQSNFQTHADNITNGVASGGGHHYSQNHQNFDSDQITDEGKRKHKFKGKPNTDGISDPIPSSNLNKNFELQPVKNKSLKEVNQPQAASYLINKSNVQYRNKSFAVMAKSLHKRKDEYLGGDDANPRKKRKRESDQHVHANLKKIKPESAMDLDDFQTPGGDLGRVGHITSSGLPNKADLKDKRKLRVLDSRLGGRENLQISGKKQKDNVQELPDNGSLEVTRNKREISSKKRQLKDSQGSQGYLPTLQSNKSDLQNSKLSVKEESGNSGFHREKKSRVSLIHGEEVSKNKNKDIPVRKSTDKILLSGNKEKNPFDRSIDKEWQAGKYRAKLPVQLTMDDIESLRKDLGSELLSVAAPSSSSKVSDSRKSRGNCKEVKGSPEESVTSSPMRMSYLNKVRPTRMETIDKVDSRLNDFPTLGSPRKSLERNGNYGNNHLGTARKGKPTSGLPKSFEHPVLDFRDRSIDKFSGNSESERSHSKERMDKNSSNIVLPQQISKRGTSMLPMDNDRTSAGNFERVTKRVSSPQIDLECLDTNKNLKEAAVIDHNCQGDKQDKFLPSKSLPGPLKGNFTDSRPLHTSVVGDLSKVNEEPANTCHQHGTNNFNGHIGTDGALSRNISAVGLDNENSSSLTPTSVLKEAKKLIDYADRLKDSGFPFESNEAYFEAALYFLLGASLLEVCNGETSKHGEMSQMQMYSSTAKLCESCALEYEKRQEMAAAALAYKCMEVSYMRVVYCKNSSTYRFLHDLQTSLPSALQGESPSSSASDIDNLNNLMVDKAVLSKENGSQAVNNVIVPRNRPNLVRLLDFTKDVNSAMEASRKSQNAFAAANVNPEDAQNEEGIVSVKKVIDFSFQNVEELVHLVRLAFKAINRQGFNGNRD